MTDFLKRFDRACVERFVAGCRINIAQMDFCQPVAVPTQYCSCLVKRGVDLSGVTDIEAQAGLGQDLKSVSYTHLTLPTIYSV